jgi:ankyrin repeat protein/L-ascorbate metabolism protein UlaG (beta-lactamase superfamily)
MKNLVKARCLVLAMLCIAFQQAYTQDIYTAVVEGNVEMTRQFLEKDPGLLNLKNQDLLTPLNLAAERNQFEVAVLLLKMGADPTIGDNENSQPIHLAAISGSIPILDLLLEKGMGIDTRDINQMTPLLFAISRGQIEMTKHLVALGADVKARSITGLTALHMSTISGNVEIMSLLLNKGAKVSTSTDQGFTPLHTAASYGKTDAMKFLVENGADIKAETDEGAQPLSWAVGPNSLGAAEYLISKGADVNHKDNDGFTALHNVAGRGNMAIAQLLVDNGADVNAATPEGFVPLAYAAWANNPGEMGKFLILNGADVNPDPCKNNKSCTCGPNFRTPLHAACDMGKPELIEVLVTNGAKVNLFSNAGFTPLHYAVKSGNIEAVKFLVDHGAFLNIKEKEQGSTELHLAAAMGYGDIASLLIEKGSCPKMKDNCGKTPLDYSFYYGQNQIGYDMLAAGADDSKLSDYVNSECLLSKSLGAGEATVWYLGHSGWAIKTQNHFLVFDYFDDTRARKPDRPCLVSGCIDSADLKNQHLTVFSTHGHADHFNQSIFSWSQNNPGANYVLCFHPAGVSDDYTYIPVNSEAKVDGMDIYVNKSTDTGGGYLVEVDGLVIFHMGDHANGEDAISPEFTHEIDLISEKNKDIDILFGPIRGCGLGTPEQVKTGIYYTLDKLHPALFVPMHAGSYSLEYKAFVEQARENGLTQSMKYVISKGDRFNYSKGEAAAESTSGLLNPGLN